MHRLHIAHAAPATVPSALQPAPAPWLLVLWAWGFDALAADRLLQSHRTPCLGTQGGLCWAAVLDLTEGGGAAEGGQPLQLPVPARARLEEHQPGPGHVLLSPGPLRPLRAPARWLPGAPRPPAERHPPASGAAALVGVAAVGAAS